MILANVILATQVPYVMVTLFCFLVIPIETAVLFWIQRPTVALRTSGVRSILLTFEHPIG
jgi:hypothetical protein